MGILGLIGIILIALVISKIIKGFFGKDALNYIIILQLTVILSLPIVPYTTEETYNETVPVKEYQQYVESVPIVKEVCKNDPVKFFQNLGGGDK